MEFIAEHFLGNIVNFVTVLVGGIIGSLIKKGIPKKLTDSIMSAMAICVIYIGVDGALAAAPPVEEGSLLSAGVFKVLVMIISMALGTLVGELIDFDRLVNKLGDKLGEKLGKNGGFSHGFVSCSLLFCVGAMAINGSMLDAQGEPGTLFAKAIIDGISCLTMASTLGIGCAFSAFFVLIYQGTITALAIPFTELLAESTISYMSVTGSLLIVLLGLNVLGVTKVKTANMVPAMFMPILVEWLLKLVF